MDDNKKSNNPSELSKTNQDDFTELDFEDDEFWETPILGIADSEDEEETRKASSMTMSPIIDSANDSEAESLNSNIKIDFEVKSEAAKEVVEEDKPETTTEVVEEAKPEATTEVVEEAKSEATKVIAEDEKPELEEESDFTEEDFEIEEDKNMDDKKKPRKIPVGLIVLYTIVVISVAFTIWVTGTNSGKKFGFSLIAKYIHSSLSTTHSDKTGEDVLVPIIKDENGDPIDEQVDEEYTGITEEDYVSFVPRSEEYVTTYLIFGIEEIDGAANTDAMMLMSINTKDNTIKLTSLLRDTYVQIPGYYNNKLNSVYAKGARGATTAQEAKDNGAALLISVLEHTYDIEISGYACVNFSRFEKIIDLLGGVDIKLGEQEAEYLRTTNYISEPSNRTVVAGMNHLNGNQALGYCRVRKVVTLGGANNDYGRTLRQRRVINAIIDKYKSYGLMDMINIMNKCLGYVYTNITEEQLTDLLANVINNSIYTTVSSRLPADELFYDAGKKGIYNGSTDVTYAIVIDGYEEANIKKLHEFVFLDEPEQTTTEE